MLTSEFNGVKLKKKLKHQQKGEKSMLEYNKLRGRIVEKYGTQGAFANAIGISQVSLSRKLNCETGLSQSDIINWANALDIAVEDYGAYFFS